MYPFQHGRSSFNSKLIFVDQVNYDLFGPSAEMCRGFLLYEVRRILPQIFLEDYSGHFFPINEEKSGDKVREKIRRPKNKNPQKSVLPNPILIITMVFSLLRFFFLGPGPINYNQLEESGSLVSCSEVNYDLETCL